MRIYYINIRILGFINCSISAKSFFFVRLPAQILQTMKNTALTQKHIALGAKMVEFAGYNMPIQYSNLIQEHEKVRSSVGVFDVSHMGEFIIEGEKALDLLQLVTSNDVSKLSPGKIQYSYFPNETGGIVDDLLVYQLDENKYYLVVNASNIDKDWNQIAKYNDQFGCKMTNVSDETSLLAIQGPNAMATLQKLTAVNLSEIPYYHFQYGTFAGVENVLISNTGYTGAGGFEVYFPNTAAETMWNSIMEAGAEFEILPAGLGCRDTLRLEMGFCLYGNDIDDTTSPLEAGLGWITKFSKDFVSKDILAAQKEQGLKRKLAGFEMIDRGIPRKGYAIEDANGNIIGEVTSGTQSPSLQKAIGMGYLTSENTNPDTEIFIIIRDKKIKAKVVKTPFYTK